MNDDVVDEVDGKVKKSKGPSPLSPISFSPSPLTPFLLAQVRASRGVRGAAEIAAAAKGALDNINKQMRMKEGADKEFYS